jgi:hypothetical protein
MFADDTTVVGLITNNKTAYRKEVKALGVWCQENNKGDDGVLQETAEVHHLCIHVNGTAVENVESVKFLGIHIMDKEKWSTHTDSVVKKAQQPVHPAIIQKAR